MLKQISGVLLLFLALCLVSCGEKAVPDSSVPGDGGSVIEPSDLIPREDAENILGTELKDGTNEQDVSGASRCFYEGEDAYLQVTLISQSELAEGLSPRSMYDSIKENMDQEEIVPVENLGDEAYLNATGIHILRGDHYISIDLNLITPVLEDPEDLAEKLRTAGGIAVTNLEAALV